MPFTINLSNGSNLTTVADGVIDTATTSLTLIGKNYPSYGTALNSNFVHMLENFANSDAPNMPLTGQLWYDNINNNLKFYRTTATSSFWQQLANIVSASSAPISPNTNDLWYDTTNSQLKYYDGTVWQVIGPYTTNNGQLRIPASQNFTVQVGGLPSLNIDLGGRVTTPYQPRLQGYNYKGGADWTGQGLSTPVRWIPATVTLNVGQAYTNDDGNFTVPANGNYYVGAHVTTKGYGTINGRWQINGVDSGIDATATVLTGAVQTIHLSGIIPANKGDVIRLIFAAEITAGLSNLNSSYTIYLIG
jgi:hypothetical protein